MIGANGSRESTLVHGLGSLGRGTVRHPAAYEALQPLLECAPGKEDLVVAAMAAEPNVCPEAHDRPFERATRVRLAEAHHITEKEFKRSVMHG